MQLPGPHLHIGTRVAPLGLRFWDVGTRTPVRDGLDVQAFPTGHEHASLTVRAHVNPSGVWVFHHLPGMLEFERALPPGGSSPVKVDQLFWNGLPAHQRSFVVRVEDRLGRFLPVDVAVVAPVEGTHKFIVPAGTGLPAGTKDAIPLFSAPGRKPPSGVAVVRAELGVPPDANGKGKRPIAWAVVRVSLGPTAIAWGLSDRAGRATMMFPYPAAPNGIGVPPALLNRTWNVTLDAWGEILGEQAELPPRADLPTALSKAPLTLWKQWDAVTNTKVALDPQTLKFGRELVVASESSGGYLWAQ